MATKKGFEVVLTISETPTLSDDEPLVEPAEEGFPPSAAGELDSATKEEILERLC